MNQTKTNAMRELERAGIEYKHYTYDPNETEGTKVAALVGRPQDRVFKTLVTESPKRVHYVFVIPVAQTLDLKAAARAVGEKSVQMIKQKELLPLTGYIHGGCSPIGMKKVFPTVIDSSAANCETLMFSGGKIGYQIETTLTELQKVLRFSLSDLCE